MDERPAHHRANQPAARDQRAARRRFAPVNSTLELDRVLDSILAGAT
jgi:hypothetical protein